MAEVVGIRFKDTGKVYYFDPDGRKLNKFDKVIVETVRGVECGEVADENYQVPDEEILKPLRKIIRIADSKDIARYNENRKKEVEAFDVFVKKAENHKLEMKLVDVEYAFDGSKILFYFTADGRVDFRELVKDLAGTFRTRIELRQIGVRDEARMLGGIGVCGRPFCCKTFLNDFHPVVVKMAKDQGLSLNPVKISGTCGKLMCCLKYEYNTYEQLLKTTPKPGALVETDEGRGRVTETSLLKGIVKVSLDSNPDAQPKTFEVSDVKLIKDGMIKTDKAEIEALKGME
ncbi:MAG: stage 0 sporulation family protein [Clostridiales bacterium]|nr:stage 0 sporulation family protein [Clostridiales bacterium]